MVSVSEWLIVNYYGGYKLVGLFVTLGCWKEYVLCINFPDIRSFPLLWRITSVGYLHSPLMRSWSWCSRCGLLDGTALPRVWKPHPSSGCLGSPRRDELNRSVSMALTWWDLGSLWSNARHQRCLACRGGGGLQLVNIVIT